MRNLKPLLFFFFSMVISVQAQKDPKVGLVLSGGGAKGIAHVGVLKEIERSGVRIDYIGGTSMGAIVGGLYACGYTASQLEEMLATTNLSDIINDKFDLDFMSFDAKEDASRYAITLPIVKGRIQFPMSLSKGQNVYNMFVQLMYEQRNTHDFSTLPIPFYCVATDINTGEKTVLDKGYLPLAVNASSALPTLFSPVQVEGRMLIDGGIVDNYPIDEMLSKGMDVIIGVDTQTNVSSTDVTSTLSEIVTRIASFQTRKQMAFKNAKTRIYIRPELDDFSILSFDKKKEIMAQGVLAAQKARSQLQGLAKNQEPRDKEQKKIPSSFQLDRLLVGTTPNYRANYLLGKLRLKSKNTYSFQKLKEGMSNLAATQNFDAFRYTLKTENEKEVLKITLPETKHTTLFRGSLHYDKLIGALALVNLTKKHAFLKNDELSLDLMLGAYFQYAFSYFIDKGEFWSIGLSAKQHQFDTSAPVAFNIAPFAFSNPTNTRVLVQKNTLFVQTLFREEVVLGVGLAHQHNVFKTNVFDTQTDRFLYADKADYYSTLGYLKVDTRDDKFYPKKGAFFDGDVNYFFSKKSSLEDNNLTPFLIAKANMGTTLPLDSKYTLMFGTSGGLTVGDAPSSAFDYAFGGYGNAPVLNYQTFIGLPQQYAVGNSFVKAETTVDYEFAPNHHLKMMLNVGIVSDDIFKMGQWKSGIDYYSAGMAYGLQTFAGPLELTAAYSPQFGRLLFHVNIGWQF